MSHNDSPLAHERLKASFDVDRMSHFLHGGKEAFARRRELTAIVENNPLFKKSDRVFQSRTDQYVRSLQKSTTLFRMMQDLKIKDPVERYHLTRAMDEDHPLALHTVMFTPTIEGQGTAEQKAKWLPLCYDGRIIGTYAQTEMGHGSFLRGLETTATYDVKTQEFVLHSPTLTSTKWWPGCLGKTSTHCVVMAQLHIKGTSYGLHAFIVQLRSLENHRPLPGIEVGDIGPKFGYGTNDNGYLRLNQVRIPRDHMLMRFARVDPDGSYSKPTHNKLSYGTMVYVRAAIISLASTTLARACTISIRYSAVRRQFPEVEGGPEVPVLDYQTQQYTLLPLLASAYAFFFTGTYMRDLYQSTMEQLSAGDVSNLGVVHATSSGLKAVVTEITSAGIEACRKCLGGHGYSHASGLIELYQSYIPACTYEGENTVMHLQNARYLLKVYQKGMAGKSVPADVKYLLDGPPSPCPATTVQQITEPQVLLAALRSRAAALVARIGVAMASALKQNKTPAQALDTVRVDCTELSRAHCLYSIADKFYKGVSEVRDASLKAVLGRLATLFAAYYIEKDLGAFYEVGYLSPAQGPLIRDAVRLSLRQLRPDAVPLVDAWAFSDHFLNSPLGRYDGNVYEALFQWAQQEPLNRSDIPPGYEEFIKPFLKGGLGKGGLGKARL